MRRILRILGVLCVIAPFLWIGDSYFSWRWGDSLVILGGLFLCLASLLDRVAPLDALLKPSPTAGPDRAKTNVEAFEKLRHAEGQATCAGCGRVAPKRDLCYSQALDAYYHRECLARDLRWSDPSQSPK